MNDLRSFIQNHELFSVLSDDEFAQLLTESKIENYSKGVILARQDLTAEYTYLILDGFVKLSIQYQVDKKFILFVANPGYFVGLFYLFGQDKYPYTIETLTRPTQVLAIPKRTLKRLTDTNKMFMERFCTILTRKNNEMSHTLLTLDRKNVRGRIAFVLLYFAERIFHSDTYDIPISRKDISSLANISTENTVRILSEYNKEGILKVNNRSIQILDKEKLRVLSNKG